MLDDVCVITFCGPEHRDYQQEFVSLYGNNFGEHIEYSTEWLMQTDFYNQNMQMFQYRKYFGYFLWKPFIILETLQKTSKKYVLYCDVNLRFTDFVQFENSFRNYIKRESCYLVKHAHYVNKDWTKRDTFIKMGVDSHPYWNAHQVWTPLMGFDKSEFCKTLLEEYMHYCKIPEVVTEIPNTLGENLQGFIEHRWEQSVMSILAEKHRINCETDLNVSRWTTKLYSPELFQLKEETNADSLSTI